MRALVALRGVRSAERTGLLWARAVRQAEPDLREDAFDNFGFDDAGQLLVEAAVEVGEFVVVEA